MTGRPSAATAVVGVIGDPVAHSLSPLLHNTAFGALGLDWVSVGFPVPDGRAASAVAALRDLGVRGLSVTMPHKEAVAALADRLTAVAARLGAVNCLGTNGDGAVVGHNTDGQGLLAALDHGAGFRPAGRRCLVVGAGGAARAAVLALAEAGAAEVGVVNRTPARASTAAALAGPAGRVVGARDVAALVPTVDLVVDATPVQMAGAAAETAAPLVPAELLSPGQLAMHLVYHPLETRWLAAARSAGAEVLGGLGMLVHQAAAQITVWTGLDPPVEAMWAAARSAVAQVPAPGRPGAGGDTGAGPGAGDTGGGNGASSGDPGAR